MDAPPAEADSGSRWTTRLAALPTSIKFLILILVALAPLGSIAVIAFFSANKTLQTQRHLRMIQHAAYMARELDLRLAGDLRRVRSIVDSETLGVMALHKDGHPLSQSVAGDRKAAAPNQANRLCAHLARAGFGAFGGADFALYNGVKGARPLCQSAAMPVSDRSPFMAGTRTLWLEPDGLWMKVRAQGGWLLIFYPRSLLVQESVSQIGPRAISVELKQPGRALNLTNTLPEGASASVSAVSVPLPFAAMDLRLKGAPSHLPASALLVTYVPLLMWMAAALIGFVVVDRLLLRPLGRLQAAVAGYRAGAMTSFPRIRSPAREIKELGDTFARTIDRISDHERELAEALVQQTKLTREVHHRVKNNLQLIVSLINHHARYASPETAEAYASIQRRVDALSIVHRNHYADGESNAGLSLRLLLGELANNLRYSLNLPHEPRVRLVSQNLAVQQDSAIPIGFLITELVEIAARINVSAPIALTSEALVDGRCRLTVRSRAFDDQVALQRLISTQYQRIIDGLARQLRTQVEPITGAFPGFGFSVPVLES